MVLLLGTHILLWAAGLPDKLSPQAREMIENLEHRLWFSVGSLWEVTIKSGLNRPDFKVDSRLLRRGLVENGYSGVRGCAAAHDGRCSGALSRSSASGLTGLPPVFEKNF